ncbi:MAG TPA: hypothetical protein VIE13_10640 [Terriglobales bacterium]|jgi:hypothetical protein
MKRGQEKENEITEIRRQELARGKRRKPLDSQTAAAARKREEFIQALIWEGTEDELHEQLRKYGLRPGSEDFEKAVAAFRKLRGAGR